MDGSRKNAIVKSPKKKKSSPVKRCVIKQSHIRFNPVASLNNNTAPEGRVDTLSTESEFPVDLIEKRDRQKTREASDTPKKALARLKEARKASAAQSRSIHESDLTAPIPRKSNPEEREQARKRFNAALTLRAIQASPRSRVVHPIEGHYYPTPGSVPVPNKQKASPNKKKTSPNKKKASPNKKKKAPKKRIRPTSLPSDLREQHKAWQYLEASRLEKALEKREKYIEELWEAHEELTDIEKRTQQAIKKAKKKIYHEQELAVIKVRGKIAEIQDKLDDLQKNGIRST